MGGEDGSWLGNGGCDGGTGFQPDQLTPAPEFSVDDNLSANGATDVGDGCECSSLGISPSDSDSLCFLYWDFTVLVSNDNVCKKFELLVDDVFVFVKS